MNASKLLLQLQHWAVADIQKGSLVIPHEGSCKYSLNLLDSKSYWDNNKLMTNHIKTENTKINKKRPRMTRF